MAIRNMLHMSQLKAFEEFLESKGYFDYTYSRSV